MGWIILERKQLNMKKEQPIIEEVEELDLEKELAFLEAQEKDEHHD